MVVAYAVDFQSDLLPGTVPVPVVGPEGFGGSGSVLLEQVDLDKPAGIKLFAYRWIPDQEGLKGRRPAKSRCQPKDPELIPRDAVRVGRLHLGLRRNWYGRRFPGDCFGHFREQVECFWHRRQGLFDKPLLRWIFQGKGSYLPFDFWSQGLVVGKVEIPIRRSGVDSEGRGTVRSASA